MIKVRELYGLPVYKFDIGDKVHFRPREEQNRLGLIYLVDAEKEMGNIFSVVRMADEIVSSGNLIGVESLTGKTRFSMLLSQRLIPVFCGVREEVE